MASSINWDYVQKHANRILAEGIHRLRAQHLVRPNEVTLQGPGNYLISLDGVPVYIGEGIDVRQRLRTQFDARRSTFYKTFLESTAETPRNISDFRVQTMATAFGRKEIEDFGIVNIATKLNKFQKNKRPAIEPAHGSEMWDLAQEAHEDLLAEGAARYIGQPRVAWFEATPPDAPGLYGLWQEGDNTPLYVGESSELANRYNAHSTYTYFSALRRHVGSVILGLELKDKSGKKNRAFAEADDRQVNSFLEKSKYSWMTVGLGRYELEDHLIQMELPVLNRKGKRSSDAPRSP
jgi:hypothetical protein